MLSLRLDLELDGWISIAAKSVEIYKICKMSSDMEISVKWNRVWSSNFSPKTLQNVISKIEAFNFYVITKNLNM